MANRKELMKHTLALAGRVILEAPMMLARHGLDPKHFAAVVKEAVLSNPDIISCTQESLARALRKCCRDGIIPDGDSGAIVPFGNEAVAMPMVTGLKHMAYQALGAEIRAGAIYEGDAVEVIQGVGVEPMIKVTATGTEFFTDNKDAPVVGAYCWLKLPHEDMPRLTIFKPRDIDRVRASSRAKGGPWKTWPDRMAVKSCVKSAINDIRYMRDDKSETLFRVVEDDNEAEHGRRVIDGTAELVGVGDDEPEQTQAPDVQKPKITRRSPKAAAKPTKDQQAAEAAKVAEVQKVAQEKAEADRKGTLDAKEKAAAMLQQAQESQQQDPESEKPPIGDDSDGWMSESGQNTFLPDDGMDDTAL